MVKMVSQDMQEKLREFQELEQQIRLVLTQKYQFELQLREAKNTIEELDKSKKPEVHKAIGQILIKTSKESVKTELKEAIETLELRLKTLEKQEKKLNEKLQPLKDRLRGAFPGTGG